MRVGGSRSHHLVLVKRTTLIIICLTEKQLVSTIGGNQKEISELAASLIRSVKLYFL
jgi:hypothetical protein